MRIMKIFIVIGKQLIVQIILLMQYKKSESLTILPQLLLVFIVLNLKIVLVRHQR